MNISFVKWVTIERCADLVGYTPAAIRQKISNGVWAEGIHWKWADDNRQLINLEEFDKWVDRSTSKGSKRGRRPSSLTCEA